MTDRPPAGAESPTTVDRRFEELIFFIKRFIIDAEEVARNEPVKAESTQKLGPETGATDKSAIQHGKLRGTGPHFIEAE
jgi:hypothetical protein